MASKNILKLVKEGMKLTANTKGMDRLTQNFEVVTANAAGNCTFQWKVEEEQVNGFGTLHGGFTAYVLDYSTSVALMAMGSKPGVSIDLNVSYLSAAKIGDIVTVETECRKLGKTLAFLEADFKVNDKLIATGKHTKFVGEK